MKTDDLNAELAVRAVGASVDVSAIRAAGSESELCEVGGALMLRAVGNAECAAIQLAMRQRAAELNLQSPTTNDTQAQRCAHTPGPWGRNGSLITAQGAMARVVASLPSKVDRITRFPDAAARTFAERDANARLIAAAPELLAALRKCVTWAETHKRFNNVGDGGPLAQDIAKARAAIAKATEGRA